MKKEERRSAFPNRLDDVGIWHGRDLSFLKDQAEPEPLSDIAETTGDEGSREELLGRRFMVTGRIVNRRSNFVVIQDDNLVAAAQGAAPRADCQLQLYIARKGSEALDEKTQELVDAWSVCDIVAAYGELCRSRKGALYLAMRAAATLVATQATLPSEFYGLKDVEKRKRERHLDFLTNPQARSIMFRRAEIIKKLRDFFSARGFLEVETPLLQAQASGAAAKPFATHHNSLDMRLFLRVAPELYLKRLVIGGLGGVFELGRCFRNEGLSPRHNPEFTMLECYKPLRDWEWMMDCVWSCLRELARAANFNGDGAASDAVWRYQERDYELPAKAVRRRLLSLVLERNAALREVADEEEWTGLLDAEWKSESLDKSQERMHRALRDELEKHATADGASAAAGGSGWAVTEIYEKTVEPKLEGPIFVTDFPIEVSPLARASDAHPGLAERFELVMAGMEVANGFSELNDPEEQEVRFKAQAEKISRGDEQTMSADKDYVKALRYGLPPTAGAGIGVDRLVMLLCDSKSIRDVLAFPLLRPDASKDDGGSS